MEKSDSFTNNNNNNNVDIIDMTSSVKDNIFTFYEDKNKPLNTESFLFKINGIQYLTNKHTITQAKVEYLLSLRNKMLDSYDQDRALWASESKERRKLRVKYFKEIMEFYSLLIMKYYKFSSVIINDSLVKYEFSRNNVVIDYYVREFCDFNINDTEGTLRYLLYFFRLEAEDLEFSLYVDEKSEFLKSVDSYKNLVRAYELYTYTEEDLSIEAETLKEDKFICYISNSLLADVINNTCEVKYYRINPQGVFDLIHRAERIKKCIERYKNEASKNVCDNDLVGRLGYIINTKKQILLSLIFNSYYNNSITYLEDGKIKIKCVKKDIYMHDSIQSLYEFDVTDIRCLLNSFLEIFDASRDEGLIRVSRINEYNIESNCFVNLKVISNAYKMTTSNNKDVYNVRIKKKSNLKTKESINKKINTRAKRYDLLSVQNYSNQAYKILAQRVDESRPIAYCQKLIGISEYSLNECIELVKSKRISDNSLGLMYLYHMLLHITVTRSQEDGKYLETLVVEKKNYENFCTKENIEVLKTLGCTDTKGILKLFKSLLEKSEIDLYCESEFEHLCGGLIFADFVSICDELTEDILASGKRRNRRKE